MSANAKLLVNTGNGVSQLISLNANKPVKIKIEPGTKYVLKNPDDNFAPENAALQRNGNDLNVILQGDNEPAIVIEDYYISGNNVQLLGMAEDGQLYSYLVTDGAAVGDSYLIDDGTLVPVALSGMPLGSGAYLFEETEEHDFSFLLDYWPWFLGVAAVGGGVIAKAIHDNNDDHKSSPTPDAAKDPTLAGATDATGKVTGPIAYGAVTDEKKPTIYGTGEAGDTIKIYDNGKVIGTAIVAANGNWSFKPTTALTDGSHKITVTQTNPAGSTSAQSGDHTFTVDTVAPNKPIFSIIDDVGTITGAIANNASTDDNRPEITGKGEVGSIIRVYLNGKEVGSTTVDSNGKWSFTPKEALADGHYQATVTETDKAGNTSEKSPTFDFYVDTESPDKPPRPTATDNVGDNTGVIHSGDSTDDKRPEFSGKASVGNVITIMDGDKVLGSTVVDKNGNWTFTPSEDLQEGSHSVSVTETDRAGNTSKPSDPINFDVDTNIAAPAISGVEDNQQGGIVGNIAHNGLTNDNTPTLSGKAEANSIVTIYDNGSAIGSVKANSKGEWNFTTPALNDGNHAFTTQSVDSAGNKSVASPEYVVTVDTSTIASAINGVEDNQQGGIVGNIAHNGLTNDNTPTLSGKAEANSIVTIYDNGSVIGSVKANSQGEWNFTTPALNDGDHTFTTQSVDPAGNNATSPEYTVKVDSVNATPAISGVEDNQQGGIVGNIAHNGLTNDNTPTLSGQAEANSIVTIYDNGSAIGSVKADNNGEWSFTPSALNDGNHTFTVQTVDAAGNTSDKSAGYIVDIDATAPNKPTINTAGNLANNSETNNDHPTLIGNAEKGSTIAIYDNGVLIGSVVADEIGRWTFTPSEAIAECQHNFTVTATDAAGNTSQPSNNFILTADFTAPDASLLAITGVDDQVGAYTGNVNSGETTDDNRPTISGTGTAGDTIILYTKDSNGTHEIGRTTVD
ncbi:MAG: Ig-like domain-containing protein, partial [Enterobacteriaceae bacterium]|nr:Ig-like domain-containing protein [Enterobacteriaceae bacterium]